MSETADDRRQPRVVRRVLTRVLRPVPLSVLSLLVASIVSGLALWAISTSGYLFCSMQAEDVLHGAHIRPALWLALAGGFLALILMTFARTSPERLFAVMLFGAATLSAAIAFVALDSARYSRTAALDGWWCPSTDSDTFHLGFLYFFWGVPLAVLVVQAFRVWRELPLEERPPVRRAPGF